MLGACILTSRIILYHGSVIPVESNTNLYVHIIAVLLSRVPFIIPAVAGLAHKNRKCAVKHLAFRSSLRSPVVHRKWPYISRFSRLSNLHRSARTIALANSTGSILLCRCCVPQCKNFECFTVFRYRALEWRRAVSSFVVIIFGKVVPRQ